jgi:hypothetical protein
MIIVKNERDEYLCSRIKNKNSITKDVKLAMKFDTVEEATVFIWQWEWKERNKCKPIFLDI